MLLKQEGKDGRLYGDNTPIFQIIENITHSLCTLEFEDHRPFYDWLLDTLATPAHPQQIEFSRLNLNYTVTSKRKLKTLVDDGTVTGWDDPRMPTIAGLRRRGYTPESLRDFCERIGVSKNDGVVDFGLLEFCVRNHLENTQQKMKSSSFAKVTCIHEKSWEGLVYRN